MKKASSTAMLLLAVLGIVIIFIVGAYIYAVGQEDDIILDLTFEEFETFEKTSTATFVSDTTATLVSPDPSAPPAPLVLSTTVAIDVEGNVVTVESAGAPTTTFTVANYLALNAFGDINVWREEIANGNYTVETVETGGVSYWEYTFTTDAITNSYLESLQTQLVAVAAAGVPGFSLVNPSITFEGNMTIMVTINSETNILESMSMVADAPIVLSFELQAEGSEDTIPSQISIEGYNLQVSLSNFTLQDGKSIPTNPLMVLLASYL